MYQEAADLKTKVSFQMERVRFAQSVEGLLSTLQQKQLEAFSKITQLTDKQVDEIDLWIS